MNNALVVDDYKKISAKRGAKNMAVISLTTGMLSLIIGCVLGAFVPLSMCAIVTGVLAMQKCNRGAGDGWGMALAGVILGIVALALYFMVYMIIFSS